MPSFPLTAALLLGLALGGVAKADRADHFEGLPAETLEAAVQNLSEYNERLQAILDRDDLSSTDLAEVHEITYTLENALQKVALEFDDLADTLEAVHLASESADARTVQEQGRAYLETARKVID